MAMHINPAHRGLFTKKAHHAGKGVQEYAQEEAHAGGKLGKEANFAKMAKRHWKPLAKHSAAKKRRHKMAKAFMGHESGE